MNVPLKTAVLFGGQSPEHEISMKSALFVLDNLDRDRIDPDPAYILTNGKESSPEERMQHFQLALDRGFIPSEYASKWQELTLPHSERTQSIQACLLEKHYDLVIPLFHGPYGEDGTVQGLLEYINIPYTGCRTAGSAITIDKDLTRRICRDAGIPVVSYRKFSRYDWNRQREFCLKEIRRTFHYPLFVKPARQGSSFGISRADDEEGLLESVDRALQYDSKFLIERIMDGPEYAVGIIGNDTPRASVPAEFKLDKDFFDFEAKYGPEAVDDVIPAPVSDETASRLRDLALRVFRALELTGLSRIDCFIENGYIYLNEVNSLPGLGGHSVFNRIWKKSGLEPVDLINSIIDAALEEPYDFHSAARELAAAKEPDNHEVP